MFNTLSHKEIQIKTTLRFHLTNGYHQEKNNKTLTRMWGKRNPPTLWVRLKTSKTSMESSMQVRQKTRNRPCYAFVGIDLHTSQAVETALVSNNPGMNKENVVHTYNGVLFSCKEQ
jgi:hypothetical protein